MLGKSQQSQSHHQHKQQETQRSPLTSKAHDVVKEQINECKWTYRENFMNKLRCKDIYSKKLKLKGSTYSQCWKKHKKPCQYFANSISRLLLSVDGAHAASCKEMATTMSSAEGAAYKGLQQCIETVMSEIERLLSAEQKATDYRSPDDGITPDHRPTNACIRVTACNA
ncbi:hypothetical protein ACS0TY_026588 [Phlomoides rotata]